MDRKQYRCMCCDCELQGDAEFCIRCWGHCHEHCPHCSWINASGEHIVLRTGKPLRRKDCHMCANQRYRKVNMADWPCLKERVALSRSLAPPDSEGSTQLPATGGESTTTSAE